MGIAYSYSSLSMYTQCPHKWKVNYIDKIKSPSKSYFTVGTICHRVAELSANYCWENTFKNKAGAFLKYDEDFQQMRERYESDDDMFEDILDRKNKALQGTRFKDMGVLLWCIDEAVKTEEYEIVSMPDWDKYNEYFAKAVVEEKCDDPEVISEARNIISRFYNYADFSTLPHETLLSEQRMGFTKDWALTKFLADDTFYRGIVDNIIYTSDKHLVITDYKTSRKMLSKWEVKEDNQLRSYVNMVVTKIGRDNVESVTIRIIYMRFSETVEYTFMGEEVDRAISENRLWVEGLANIIEADKDYKPVRNQFCSNCHVRELDKCPLFEKVFDSSDIKGATALGIPNEKTCQEAWKRVEVLKDEYDDLTKKVKSFIEDTDAVVVIDEKAILDKHYLEKRTYLPLEVASVALEKGANLADILPFFSISETNYRKMQSKLGFNISTEEEVEKALYKTSKRSKFGAFTKGEI